MKSAYELAMERLRAKEGDTKPLTAGQKRELADIDTRYRAKIAEREIFLQQQLSSARADGQAEAITQLERQLKDERARLEEEREDAKARVRSRG